MSRHRLFRSVWWTTNLLLAASTICLFYACGWEYSVREYLKGFSQAIVPQAADPEQKVEAILSWMRSGPSRSVETNPIGLTTRDPQTTLNYKQLLLVCGTATNAFLNLSRSAGVSGRRLLLLDPNRSAKHVVAEVLINERWVIVDASYRVLLRDAQGHLLTRNELRNPEVLAEATRGIPNYPEEYNYNDFAHVRIARLALHGLHLGPVLNAMNPGWDEAVDWSLLLERESFLAVTISSSLAFFFLSTRFLLGWYADKHLKVSRFRLREHFVRAGAAFLSTPGLK
jgi:hypothetical protein